MNFVCPKCNGNVLEEVMTDVTVVSDITSIYSDCADYGEQTNEDGTIDCFQCKKCGSILETNDSIIDNYDALYNYLKENNMLEEHELK